MLNGYINTHYLSLPTHTSRAFNHLRYAEKEGVIKEGNRKTLCK